MSVIRLTKEFSFEMAHALEGYDGACRHIHGHSYKLFVTVKGEPISDIENPKYGMVTDFGELKKIINRLIIERYDHALVIRLTEQNKQIANTFGKVELTDYQPTCENMIVRFADQIKEALPKDLALHHIKLHETATSYAEWYAEDNA